MYKNEGMPGADNEKSTKPTKKMPTLERKEQEAKDKDNAEKLAK